jgi:hypothetical protein
VAAVGEAGVGKVGSRMSLFTLTARRDGWCSKVLPSPMVRRRRISPSSIC